MKNFEMTPDACHGSWMHFFLVLLIIIPLALTYHKRVHADNLIEGTVSLPTGDAALAEGVSLVIWAADQNGPDAENDHIFIPEGESSATYSIVVPSEPLSEWMVYYICWIGCEYYGMSGYYANDGTVWYSSIATLLAGDADHAGIDLTLLTGDLISGNLLLPPGDVAPTGGQGVNIYVKDQNGAGDESRSIFIPEGESSATYSMAVPSEPSADWLVRYWCDAFGYIADGYYAIGGTTPYLLEATLLAGGVDHPNTNLAILKDIHDSCTLDDEVIAGPVAFTDDYYCSAQNSITAGDALGVVVENGAYVVYSAPVIQLMPGFSVMGGIFRVGANIYP